MSAEIIGVTGSGIMIMSGDVPDGSLCATNEVSRLIEDLQFMLGQGPCVEAHETGAIVAEPNLAAPSTLRWSAFTPAALDAGVRALFAFPMRVGGARLGALNLYRDLPGGLTDDQHADAIVMADVAARWVLRTEANALPGDIPEELESNADLHFAVHNAAGMLSVQLGVSVTEALIRLRAYAFRTGRQLGDVAEDVVTRRLRIE